MDYQLNPHYDRPVLMWGIVAGLYLSIAGLVAVLGVLMLRATSRPTERPREEHPEVARLLEDMRASRGRPSSAAFDTFVRDYLEDGRVLLCPSIEPEMRETYWPDPRPGPRGVTDDMAYCYVSGLKATDAFGSVLAFDEEWNHGAEGVNVLYRGTHVKWVPDVGSVREAAEAQLEKPANGRRGVALVRPWWSRTTEPPPFFRIPEEDEKERGTWPVAASAAGLACGVLFLSWYRRHRSAIEAARAAERAREERKKRKEQDRRPRPGRRVSI